MRRAGDRNLPWANRSCDRPGSPKVGRPTPTAARNDDLAPPPLPNRPDRPPPPNLYPPLAMVKLLFNVVCDSGRQIRLTGEVQKKFARRQGDSFALDPQFARQVLRIPHNAARVGLAVVQQPEQRIALGPERFVDAAAALK